MKALWRLTLPLIAFFLMAIPVMSSASPIDHVPNKHKNLFVLVAKRGMRGADLTVFYSNGDLVAQHTMKKRKMIIDFCDVISGTYTIVVQKGGKREEFKYDRK